MRREFVQLQHPLYWRYGILGGLKVMAGAGLVRDLRREAALALLASKQLPDGGFAAEARHYKCSPRVALGNDAVDWRGTGRRGSNPWVTADALGVLGRAGRLA